MTAFADGPLIVAVNQIKELLADAYHWRRIASSTAWDDATALAHVHIDAIPEPGVLGQYTANQIESLLPFALIKIGGEEGFTIRQRANDPNCAATFGHNILRLVFRVPAEHTNNERALGEYLIKLIGKIVWTNDDQKPGMWDLAGQPDRIHVRELTIGEYFRTPENQRTTQGDLAFCDIDIKWGQN